MKNRFKFLIAPAAIACWCLFCLAGCKNSIIENTNLATGSDNLKLAKDSLKVKSVTQFHTPIASNGVVVGALGSLYDKNFGTTYGSFYAQPQLTTNGFNFLYNTIFDSVVLTMAFNGQYGLCTKPIDINVYELSQDLYNTTYYTTSSFHVKTPVIGQLHNFVPDFFDSVNVGGAYLAPHIRIPLSTSFGMRLTDPNNALNYTSDSTFLAFFKGLYVTTGSNSTGNGLMYINFPSSLTGLTVYYRYTLAADSTTYYASTITFPFYGVLVDHFDNTYYGAPILDSINSTNPNGQQKIYVQGGAGTRGKITVNMDSVPKKIAINKAELVFSQSAGDTQYTAPASLNLLRIDDAGVGQNLEDAGSSNFGGVREDDIVNGVTITRYRFNMSRYFQKLLQGIYNNNGFYISAINPYDNAERIVLSNSSTDKNYSISLVLTYTKL